MFSKDPRGRVGVGIEPRLFYMLSVGIVRPTRSLPHHGAAALPRRGSFRSYPSGPPLASWACPLMRSGKPRTWENSQLTGRVSARGGEGALGHRYLRQHSTTLLSSSTVLPERLVEWNRHTRVETPFVGSPLHVCPLRSGDGGLFFTFR